MARRERIETVCDYPGCERRVTELGGTMVLTPKGPGHVPADTEEMAADLCREHRRQLEAWWNRKAEDQPEPESDDDSTTAAPRASA